MDNVASYMAPFHCLFISWFFMDSFPVLKLQRVTQYYWKSIMTTLVDMHLWRPSKFCESLPELWTDVRYTLWLQKDSMQSMGYVTIPLPIPSFCFYSLTGWELPTFRCRVKSPLRAHHLLTRSWNLWTPFIDCCLSTTVLKLVRFGVMAQGNIVAYNPRLDGGFYIYTHEK